MSYVSEKKRGNPLGMGAAVLVNGSIILAIALSPLVVQPPERDKGLEGRPITLQPPPEPEVEKPKDPLETPPIFAPKPQVQTQTPPKPGPTITETETATTILNAGGGDDEGAGTAGHVRELPTPIFKAAMRDPRFARVFQPDYPVGMLRLEIEGSVTVRVLVGTDGRVRQVQVLSATDPDFARATEKQALKAWRFKPATRDGVAVEDWQTLTVRFDIN
jgi:periplasmic protein TonB